MEKPKSSHRVFVAHFVNGQPAIAQRHTDARGTITYEVVLVLRQDRTVEFQSGAIKPEDVPRFMDMIAQMQSMSDVQRKVGPFDPLGLVAAHKGPINVQQMLTLKLLEDYTASAMIYATNMAAYMAGPVEQRYKFDYSLDLYRQALGFHDVPSMMRLIDEDGAFVQTLRLRGHVGESVYDALFHLAQRVRRRDAAFEFLCKGWAARRTAARGYVLIDEAAFFQKSELIVEIADFLEKAGKIIPRNLAQLTVAQQRLGQRQQAEATAQRLFALTSDDAKMLAPKIAQFLDSTAP